MNPKLRNILFGKRITLVNLITNGDFVDDLAWSPSGATESVSNNTYFCTGSGASATPYFYQSVPAHTVGHIYYTKGLFRVRNSNCTTIRVSGGANMATLLANPTIDAWYPLSAITVATTADPFLRFYQYYANSTNANGAVMEAQYIVYVDLTNAFGAGNEPSVDDMNSIINKIGWFIGSKIVTL